MKICVITTVSKTMDWFVVDTMRYFHKKGEEITLVCDMDEAFKMQNSDFAKCISVPLKRGIDPLGMLKTIYQLVKLFRKEKYDLIQYATPVAALCASVAGKLVGIKVRVYCQWGIRYVGFSGVKRVIFKMLEKMVCTNSTHVEPDSKGNLQFGVEEKLYSLSKASVIWNGSACGINLERFCMAKKSEWRTAVRSELRIRDTEFVFGFVGRLTKDKGIDELVNAYKRLSLHFPSCRLMLIGDHEEIRTLQATTQRILQEDNGVIMTGRVLDAERYFSAMDAFLLPSYREGFGSVVIEAAAMGLPIVVTDIPGPTDVIVNEENGLIIPKQNEELLYEAMARLINDYNLCEKLGDSAYRTAINGYEQQQFFEHVYEDRKRLLRVLQ